ncbi:hypothetical protein M3667_15405 [Microbacterium sp. P26]|uniref:hypothetical protein n=1 Tax=Microbacterium TaxID=33882 RepID=UPI002041F0C8|nr:hypothetical protein [Microbacterium sp. P26]MCM3503258.1 hypothetical protein [Microbacterium sp. P26]
MTIRDGADSTTDQWNAGRSIRVESSQPVVGITVKSSVDTTMVSCEILRDGITVAADERAGSVDCSYIAGGD